MTAVSRLQCNVRESFTAAFRAWRQRTRTPLKQVADDLGLAISTVNSWELGQRFPSGANFEKLVAYTGLPPCRLLCLLADECVPAKCLLALRRRGT